MGATLAAALAVGAVVVGSAVPGIAPAPTVAGASAKVPCAARSVSGPIALEMKLKMAKSSAGKLPTVAVCINGKGPYPFLVSTGAGSSVVTPGLARSLHLRKGSKSAIRGVTCVGYAATARAATWSMAGFRLAPQALVVAKIAADGASPAPEGVIGSDVLERFAAVRIDYHTSRILLATTEGPALTGNVLVLGKPTATLPHVLSGGAVKLSAPLRIFESPQGTTVVVPAIVSGRAEQLAIDSGAFDSAIEPKVAASLKLADGGRRGGRAGIGCEGSASSYVIKAWSIGGKRLPRASLVSERIEGTFNSSIQGVLGSDVLSADGSVIVDYEGAHLWLVKG
jgi:predicted aspartyl protease